MSLPGILAEIAEIAGVEAAYLLARHRGGVRVYVPQEVYQGHWLVRLLGKDAAGRICRFYGGNSIEIPLASFGSRKQIQAAIEQAKAEGASAFAAARRAGVSHRTVRRQWKKRSENKNLPLFGDLQ